MLSSYPVAFQGFSPSGRVEGLRASKINTLGPFSLPVGKKSAAKVNRSNSLQNPLHGPPYYNAVSRPHHHRHHVHHQLTAHPSALATVIPTAAAAGLSQNSMAAIFMSLLALQFAVQPALSRKYTSQKANRRGVIFVQEIIKFTLAGIFLLSTGMDSTRRAVQGWTFKACAAVAGIPAALYAVQNVCALMAYQNLDSVTFNVLNQTKTLSAALCCFLIMGKGQSRLQIFSLLVLFVSSLITEGTVKLDAIFGTTNGDDDDDKKAEIVVSTDDDEEEDKEKENDDSKIDMKRRFTMGIIPVALASFISGLAGALAQKSLQGVGGTGGGRNSQLFTMELSFFSAIVLALSIIGNENDRESIKENGLFYGWTPKTLIPLTVNAAGGILVGLVTKYAGSVRKGFALIAGLFLTGIFQAITEKKNLSREQYVGSILAMIGMYMHLTHEKIRDDIVW
eukprot:CAMPEP_0185729944 /NCGR_PEP_ID=MMETSP1171-20130828/7770_1 /TAXON_ID=374046 /ORGANISM="Helicotheca tamensis, Strain CCMP826" /LENGTH=450 /DNA_ID=CAMNT_0028398893 /DNA_START=27 /DNA_END=1376 /DNA_ORIENTATION=+